MKEFNKKIQEQFKKMQKTGKLFRVNMTGRQVWTLYLASFPEEMDPKFRDPESSVHNCNHCNNFIKRYGNIVCITEDYKLESIFNVLADEEYNDVAVALNAAITRSDIKDVFFETFTELNGLPYEKCSKSAKEFQLGIDKNVKRYTKEEAEKYGVVKANEIKTFNHMNLKLDKQFVDMGSKSIESIMAEYRDAKNVFKRAMDEISLDTYKLVKDLIAQGSLLDGTTHAHKIEKMIPFKAEYDKATEEQKDIWCWFISNKLPFAKFRNELIGVLCSELSQGEEINKACQSWNKRVDPANYMKAVAPITKQQIALAKTFVEENGYAESFTRRFATIDDIKVTEIKHISTGNEELKNVSMFDAVKPGASQHKRNEFKGIEEVSIDKFMQDILPGCDSVEAYLENFHEGNMVSLTTTADVESKPIFKWNNNYSWTFSGNLAGKSQIKEAVKSQGGKVDGVLRASIMWAEGNVDNSDLDLHCKEPRGGIEIYYSNSVSSKTAGNLDIDITQPQAHKKRGRDVVENITYPSLDKMIDGTYKFFVYQFTARNSKGFTAEIEFNGEIFSYSYDRPVQGNVALADVTLKDGEFSIKHHLPESASSREFYSLETKQFHKVNLMCLSPNHWDNNKAGNKHYFFMLDKCSSPLAIRSFHNENLIPELAEHRKVLEVLGATNMIEPGDKQLSGLGFNSTVKDELIVKLTGNFKRMIKIKF